MTSWSPEFFQTIMGPFVNNTGWFGSIYDFALPLYFMMATISLAFVMGYGMISRDAAGTAADLGRTLIGIGFGWVILNNADIIGNAIYNTFLQIAGSVGGVPAAALSPDGLMVWGAGMVGTMTEAVGFGTWLMHPAGAILILVIALLILIFFLIMAGILMVLIIEGFFAIVGGTIFIPFGAFHWTSAFLNMWLMWIMAVSVQLFFMYLVLSVGVNMEEGWAAQFAASQIFLTSNLWVAFIALAEALTFMFIALWLPLQARRIVYGSGPGIGFGSMIRGAVGAFGEAGAVASNISFGAAAASAGGAASASQSSAFQAMMAQP
jgi:type IV secretion system protein TrbL